MTIKIASPPIHTIIYMLIIKKKNYYNCYNNNNNNNNESVNHSVDYEKINFIIIYMCRGEGHFH